MYTYFQIVVFVQLKLTSTVKKVSVYVRTNLFFIIAPSTVIEPLEISYEEHLKIIRQKDTLIAELKSGKSWYET